MNSLSATAYSPPGVQVELHGHVHDFQAINFTSNHPATIVAGNAGDSLDVALPDPFPAISPASGVTVGSISHNNSFGFMVMDRQAAPAKGWLFNARKPQGTSAWSSTSAAATTSALRALSYPSISRSIRASLRRWLIARPVGSSARASLLVGSWLMV